MADFIDKNPKALGRLGWGTTSLASTLIEADAGTAVKLISSIDGKKQIEEIAPKIGEAWYQTDPDAARQHVGVEADPAKRAALIDGITKAALQSGWRQTLDWVVGLGGDDGDRAMGNILAGVRHDPLAGAAAASEWLKGAGVEVVESDATRKAIESVAKALTESTATEAGDWATNLPQGKARETAVASVSENWSSFDPAGASEWLATLPQDAARDTAVENLVNNIPDDPVGAFEWGLFVGDEKKRGELLGGVVKRWRHSDPDAAREAINGAAELSADERDQLLDQLENDAG